MATGSPGRAGAPSTVVRDELTQALPASIRNAVSNYRGVALADPPDDAKAFQQHQAACKAALQHIEALMKLAAAVDAGSDNRDAPGPDTASIIARAEAAVDAYTGPGETEGHEE